MNINHDQPTNKKPFYKRPRFYGFAALMTVIGLFLLLLFSIIALRWVNPPVTSFMYQQEWQEIGMERYSLNEYWVPAEEIPEHMKWAVIASEDQRFREHWGLDVESIKEALDERKQGERIRGASTISQQVSKNLFLWPAESFFRKGLEAGITVLIEFFWPKERILEVYLNIAEFGPGIFGIGKASETFYNVQAASITPEMAAQFAAVLPSPKRMRVNPPSPYAEERSKWILRQMTQLSGIPYYRPKPTTETKIDTILQPAQPDSLPLLSDEDFHFNNLDSLINSFEGEPLPLSDSLKNQTAPDSVKPQE